MTEFFAERDGIALGLLTPADAEALAGGEDLAFLPDPDPRPLPLRVPVAQFGVLDAADGTLLGRVSWWPVLHGPTLACAAWEIGITLLPGARGRGIGRLAQRLLAEYLFATTELDRVEAVTDVANAAEQRALAAAGFRREGVLRGGQVRGGVRRDLVCFGLLRSDP